MKGSINSFVYVFTTVALSLFSMNANAQLATAEEFSATLFTASTTEGSADYGTTATGAQIISAYQEDAAIIRLEGKFGLINRQGYEIVAPIYDNVHLFNKGYAAVSKNGKWTFVNKQGKRLTPLRYDWVGGFDQGHAPVLNNGQWGLLNEQGFEVVPTAYDAVKIDQDGKIWVERNGTWKQYAKPNQGGSDYAEAL